MIEKFTVANTYTVKQATEKMVANNIKAVVILDENKKAVGLFSNGDMRNYFLAGGTLSSNITMAMNNTPFFYRSMEEVNAERIKQPRVIYPIVNEEGVLIQIIYDEIEYNQDIMSDALEAVPLVIMAGGKGTRLYPYTKVLPKPLIPIGDKTIVERIIDTFGKYGCRKVYFLLNHKAEIIKAYLNEISTDYNIKYAIEKDFLGTAGGLKLLEKEIDTTFILSNCDILINDDLECAYKTHIKNENRITFICSMKNVVIPYGVVDTDEVGNVVNLREKPDFSYLVNTGVYIVEPDVISEIRKDEFIHMPDLARRLLEKGQKVGVFPISEESWLDMGQITEMKRMMEKMDI